MQLKHGTKKFSELKAIAVFVIKAAQMNILYGYADYLSGAECIYQEPV